MRLETLTVKLGVGSVWHVVGAEPPLAASWSTADDDEALRLSEPPKNESTIGVRKLNRSIAATVIVLPVPLPAPAALQSIGTPSGSAQVVAKVRAPSPPWPWTLTSWPPWTAIPASSVGLPAAYTAASRDALVTAM